MKQIFNLDKDISILCLSVMLFTVIAQVLMRELFNMPLVGAEEFVRYMMIWIVLFPLAFTLREGGHIEMTELRDMLPLRLRTGLKFLSDVSSIIVFAVISWSSLSVILENANNTTATLQIPFWIFFLPNFLGFLLLTVGYVLILTKRIVPKTSIGVE
jgi:TRAP-type C4-dicarboxylate transport system permease small subunit